MARKIASRLRIIGTLHAESALHVGSKGDDVETDLPLARDGQDRFHIPGTALAGPLRSWMEDHLDYLPNAENLCKVLWGYQPRKDVDTEPGAQREEGWASYLLVKDAPLPADLTEELRDGVGIDRQWGTAGHGLKYDRCVLPKGSGIPLEMVVELPEGPVTGIEPNRLRAAVGRLLEALQQCAIGLGAAKTRGLGRVKLELRSIHEERWNSKEGVLEFLKGTPSTIAMDTLLEADPHLKPQPAERLHLTIHWRAEGPVMSRAGYDGLAVDALPLVASKDSKTLALLLSGSGIKGALRGQAERIVRTVLGATEPRHIESKVPWPQESRDRHNRQIDVPLVRKLFGSAKKTTGHRGALAVADCYASNILLTRDQWQGIVDAPFKEHVEEGKTSPLYEKLGVPGLQPGQTGPYLEQGYHVAVDRWTGGAAENLLFSGLEPFGVSWEPMQLTLDIRRLPEKRRQAGLALLLLLLRDLAEQRLPLGFGINRGYGCLRVTAIDFIFEGEDAGFTWLNGLRLEPVDLTQLPTHQLNRLQTAWQDWIKEGQDGD